MQSRYKAPPIATLRQAAVDLLKSYKGSNQERSKRITGLQRITQYLTDTPDEEAVEVIVGLIICEIENIIITYPHLSPERSEMFRLLNAKINNAKTNPLNDMMRIVYLQAALRFLRQHPNLKAEPELINLVKVIQKRVIERDMKSAVAIMQGPPRLNVLQDKVRELRSNYFKRRPNTVANRLIRASNREELIAFCDFVNTTCKQIVDIDERNQDDTVNRNSAQYEKACMIRLGVPLMAIIVISDSYWVLSPEGGYITSGSELLKEFLEMANIDLLRSFKSLDPNVKIAWLRALHVHISSQAVASLAVQEGYSSDMLIKYINLVNAMLHRLELEKTQPSLVGRAFRFAAKHALIFAATEATTGLVLDVGNVVVQAVAGASLPAITIPTAAVFFLGNAMIYSSLSHNLAHKVFSGVSAWIVNTFSGVITETAVGVVALTFSTMQGGLGMLHQHPNLRLEDRKLIDKWVATLLELDDDVFSADFKLQLKGVMGEPVAVPVVAVKTEELRAAASPS